MIVKKKKVLLITKLVFVLLLCPIVQVSATSLNLSTDPNLWDEELQEIGNLTPDEACTFEIANSELRVGPWLAGEYAARYLYNQDINVLEGTVQGYYKTENAEQGQAQVAIYFKDSSENIKYKYKFQLPNATQWTQFSFPIRRGHPDSTCIAAAFGNCLKNNGKVYFKDIQINDNVWAVDFPQDPPALTRAPAPTDFIGTGKWRLEERAGTWWFVKPNGEAFYSIGLEAPYVNDSISGQVLDILQGMAFNTLDGWTDIYNVAPVNSQRNEPMAAITALESGTLSGTFDRLVSAQGETPNAHTMPDPFDPGWKEALISKVSAIKSRTDGEGWFIGYFADNEVSHYDLHRKVYSNYCSQAFKAWLEDRYGNIADLNTAWSTSYTSFDALISAKPDPIMRYGTMYEDFMAFKRVLVQKYVDESKSAFMEVYNNNPPLLFSNRFTIDLSDVYDVLDIYAEAYDGIAINCYPGGIQAGLPEWLKETITKAYNISGKPILISEWSVPALDSGLYTNWSTMDFSFPECVDTQVERASQAAAVTAELYNTPYIVGSHWFKWYDINNSSRKANRGLFKSDAITPWTKLQTSLRNIQETITGYEGARRFFAVADSYVRGGLFYKNTNYGTESKLNVKDSSSEWYDRRAYLKFELGEDSPDSCTNAVLKLYCSSLPNGQPVTVKAFGVYDDSWIETEINWNNAPTQGIELSSVNITQTGVVYQFDVTSFVSSQLAGDGIVSFGIVDDALCNKEVHFQSREGSFKPVLEITY